MDPVTRNGATHRFEVTNRPSAFLVFAESPGRIRLIHTEVPPELRGEGHASALARTALEYARSRHLRVEPACPFVREYIARHPEYEPLVDAGDHRHTPEEERRLRERALDETIAASFPASDPPSTDPNPEEDE